MSCQSFKSYLAKAPMLSHARYYIINEGVLRDLWWSSTEWIAGNSNEICLLELNMNYQFQYLKNSVIYYNYNNN